jgi:hypothetical protein
MVMKKEKKRHIDKWVRRWRNKAIQLQSLDCQQRCHIHYREKSASSTIGFGNTIHPHVEDRN